MNSGSETGWTIAVLGFGEAGAAIAAGLAGSGARVRGYDPVQPAPPGVEPAVSDQDACRGADLVLSLTTAAEADNALRQSLPGLGRRDGPVVHGPVGYGPVVHGPVGYGPVVHGPVGYGPVVYADANTTAAGQKQRLAAVVAGAGAGLLFADIAIMSPVPGQGHRVPMITSGDGAERARAILASCGGVIEALPGPAGAAATRKLLRSVFYKGMAAAVIEALVAARSAGCEDWLREHIAEELAAADAGTLARMEQGSYRHAERRVHEMAAATELLGELGVPARIAHASQLWLEELAAKPPPA